MPTGGSGRGLHFCGWVVFILCRFTGTHNSLGFHSYHLGHFLSSPQTTFSASVSPSLLEACLFISISKLLLWLFFSYSSTMVSFSSVPFRRGTAVCTVEVLCLPMLLFSFDEKTDFLWVYVWFVYLLVHSRFKNTFKVYSLLPFLGWEEEEDGKVHCIWFFLKTFRLYLHKGLFASVPPQTAEANNDGLKVAFCGELSVILQ